VIIDPTVHTAVTASSPAVAADDDTNAPLPATGASTLFTVVIGLVLVGGSFWMWRRRRTFR
jgi:LPXTG-motif cell wall-anchored protein